MNKKYSVMVLPKHTDKLLLQKITEPDGSYFWDGFGSFCNEDESFAEASQRVVSSCFNKTKTISTPEEVAIVRFIIKKPDLTVDLETHIYFLAVDSDQLAHEENCNWFSPRNIPYPQMHMSTERWLSTLLQEGPIVANLTVNQANHHAKGIVEEFKHTKLQRT